MKLSEFNFIVEKKILPIFYISRIYTSSENDLDKH